MMTGRMNQAADDVIREGIRMGLADAWGDEPPGDIPEPPGLLPDVSHIDIPMPTVKPPRTDLANQAHYTQGEIEPWDYAKAQGWYEGAACYCILKYITRYKFKGGAKDLKKAHVFLGDLIKYVEAEAK